MNAHVVWGIFASMDDELEGLIAQAIKDVLDQDVEICFFHRDYQFENRLASHANKPTLVLSNGVTKTRFDDESVHIYYSPRRALRQFNCEPAIVSPTFLGFYFDWLFRLKLRCFKRLNRLSSVFA